ncbi:hypothetical protein ACJIZ3_003959 [Penstemon smallii]|uniref:Uncharacterized protein n=1 Tax=Penstemon smallii TaxID=265156 RepID=A0ABD3S0P5_9LAMI
MTGDSLSPRNEKISFKKSPNPIEGAFFELADFDYKNRTPSENDKSGNSNSHHQTSEILSTTDIVSAVSYVWGRARQPLSLLLSKTNPTCKSDVIQGGDSFHYTAEKGAFRTFTIADDEPSSGDLTNKTKSTILEQGNTENLKENKKISSSQTIYEFCSLWRMLHAKSTMIDNSSVENCPSSTRIPHNLGSIYLWMSEIALNKQKKPVICVRFEDKTEETTECQIFTSKSDKDSKDKKIAPCNSDCENSMKEIDEGTTYVKANSSDVDFSLSDNKKPQYALAKQEHAFAGAMAGIFVSLCLHPMDTVKTVIQSCRSDQKSLHYIGRSIISERGVTGLYRGISSNLVTSAPISAIYTFTYESVKKTLLPLLPKWTSN